MEARPVPGRERPPDGRQRHHTRAPRRGAAVHQDATRRSERATDDDPDRDSTPAVAHLPADLDDRSDHGAEHLPGDERAKVRRQSGERHGYCDPAAVATERSSAGEAMTKSDVDVALPFFFQAEDGIRDYKVTGVQTCALPI